MKRRACLIISVIVLFSMCFSVSASQIDTSPTAQPNLAASASPVVSGKPVYEIVGYVSDYEGDYELTFARDLTGDEAAEKIDVRATEDGVIVSVKGEKSLTIMDSADFYSIGYIRINAENEFFLLNEVDEPGYDETFTLFRYNPQTKQLDFIQDLRRIGAGRFAYQFENVELSGTYLKITALTQVSAIGGVYFDVDYVFEGDRFVTEYKETEYISENERKDFTCDFDLDFYQSPGSFTKSFSASRGSTVTIEKVFFDASYAYGYFTQGNNAGWMCFDSSQPYYAFIETRHFN